MSKKRFLIAIILVFVVMFSAKNVESSHSGDSQSEPSHEKGIRVKIDETGPELWDFHFTSSSSDCYIKLTDEDDDFLGIGGRDDNAESLGIKGEIIKHTGSNSLSSASGSCSGERDACEILKRKWSGGMKKKCGDCSLAEGNTIYRPKGDLLCGFDGYWYLCYSDFHGGSDKIFNKWGHAYKCTTSNEWQIVTEICGNDKNDDGDNQVNDCDDDDCKGHASCEADNNEQVCKNAGHGYEEAASPNRCCGDYTEDDGKVVNGLLCKVTDRKGQWLKALDNTGKIILNKDNIEYVSDGTKWVKCDQTFEDDKKNIKNIDGKDYFCTNKGKDSVVVCCGDSQECKSKTDGKRLTTGKSLKGPKISPSNPATGSVVYDVSSITGKVSHNRDFLVDGCDNDGICENWESSETCPNDCSIRVLYCGNSICDNNENYLNCEIDCQFECGNNICDSGENNNNCQKDCESICGNNALDAGEACDVVGGVTKFRGLDGNVLSDNQCQSYNPSYASGNNLECNNCQISTSKCVVKSTCGDGRIDPGEDCDGTNRNNKGCEDVGDFSGGTLACYPPSSQNPCKFDTSGCVRQQEQSQEQLVEATFYCKSDFKFVTDLDTPNSQSTCNAAGFKWTGTKCCSEDDDIIVARNIYEFYNDPSGIGGCWNSTAVLSVNLVDGTNFSVINYNGGFHGCAVKEINFNKDNDNLLRILDKHTVTNLITDHVYCFSDTSKSYYCSYAETWNLTYGKDKAVLKSAEAIVAMPKQIKECCAQDQCWNGTVCIDNQKNDNSLLSKLTGDSYRCVDGEWKKSEIKPNIDGTESGYCADETQCLVDSDASDLSKRCIASGSYTDTGDNYCDNGQWSSRTKLLALKLLNIKGNEDFTLFCDNKENALNNLMYNIDAKGISQILGSDLQTNNFCILEFSRNKKVIVAASMNADPKNKVSAMLKIFNLRINACNANAFNADGQYHFCDAEKKLWFNYKLKSFIYSTSGITVTSDESTILSDLINRLINLAKGISYPSVDDSFVRNIKKFDRLYMTEYKINPATSEKRTINAAIESKSAINIKSAVFEYKNFDTNICSFIVQYKNRLSSDRISCSGNNKDYSAVVQGSEFYPPDPDLIWPDLTSKLRLR